MLFRVLFQNFPEPARGLGPGEDNAWRALQQCIAGAGARVAATSWSHFDNEQVADALRHLGGRGRGREYDAGEIDHQGGVAGEIWKNQLQRFLQKRDRPGNHSPVSTYKLVSSRGPPHQRRFVSSVTVSGVVFEGEECLSKKASEQSAAYAALGSLTIEARSLQVDPAAAPAWAFSPDLLDDASDGPTSESQEDESADSDDGIDDDAMSESQEDEEAEDEVAAAGGLDSDTALQHPNDTCPECQRLPSGVGCNLHPVCDNGCGPFLPGQGRIGRWYTVCGACCGGRIAGDILDSGDATLNAIRVACINKLLAFDECLIDFTRFARLSVPRASITSKALLIHYLIGLGCIEDGNLGARGNLDEIVRIVDPEMLTHGRLSGQEWVVDSAIS